MYDGCGSRVREYTIYKSYDNNEILVHFLGGSVWVGGLFVRWFFASGRLRASGLWVEVGLLAASKTRVP
jgi:hypothetical protein